MSSVPSASRPRARGAKLVRMALKLFGTKFGLRRVSRDHGHLQAQFRRELRQVFIEVQCCVLEGGEHQQLAIGFAVPVGGRVLCLVPEYAL